MAILKAIIIFQTEKKKNTWVETEVNYQWFMLGEKIYLFCMWFYLL